MSWLKLYRIIRPYIVVGGLLGYILGVLLAMKAGASFQFPMVALGYLVVFFGDLSTHFSNDYYDKEIDGAQVRKLFSGVNVLVKNPQLASLAIYISILLAFASVILAFTLMLIGASVLVVLIASGAVFLGWLYSAPPIRLCSRGLGEISIALGVGFGIPAFGYIITNGRLDSGYLPLMIPLFLYGLVLSISLGLPDINFDARVGKNTLTSQLGSFWSSMFIIALCVISSGIMWLEGLGVVASLLPLAASFVNLLAVLNEYEWLGYKVQIGSLFGFLCLLIIEFASTSSGLFT